MIQIRPERKRKILSRLRSRIALALAALLLFSSAGVRGTGTKDLLPGRAGAGMAPDRVMRRALLDKGEGKEHSDSPVGNETGEPAVPEPGETPTETPPTSDPTETSPEQDPQEEIESPTAPQDTEGQETGEEGSSSQDDLAGDNGSDELEETGEETDDAQTGDQIDIVGNHRADVETARDWELLFVNMEFTGDWNQDFLNVVFSQLGYTASRENFIVEDGVRQSYTRYGAWFGFPYGAWCAMFVSFCLNYAGVPKEAMLQSASVARMVEWLRSRDRFKFCWDDYAPQPGDLVFFSQTRRRTPTHVGVVTGVMNNTLLTVEGNNGPTVAVFMYDIHDPTIVGYGIFPDQSEYSRAALSEPETESEPESTEPLAIVPDGTSNSLTVTRQASQNTQ